MKIRSTRDRWVADARSLNGGERKYPKTQAGKRQARARLKQVEAEHRQKGAYTNPAASPAVPHMIDLYLQAEDERAKRGDLGEAHLNNKRVALRDICAMRYGNKTVSSLKLGDLSVGGIKNELIPSLFAISAYATAQKKFVIFKHFLKWCYESEYLLSNPAEVTLPKRPVAEDCAVDRITKAHISSIIAAAEPKYRLAIKFAAFTGLRSGEQRALTWRNIDFDRNLVVVNKAIQKGGKIGPPKTRAGNRAVPMAAGLLNELREWKVLQPLTERGENLVFPNGVGSIDDSSNLRNRGLHPACRAAGVEEIRWHDLRHFFASILLYDLKEPDPVICELMGHSNIAFTHQIYGHWMTDARRDAEIASRLSLAFGGE